MSACWKRTFWSRADANRKKKQAARTLGHRMFAYRCQACGWWHLSSLVPTGAKSRRKYA